MRVEKIFDYVEEKSNDTGIDITLVFEETRNEEVENDFLPFSLENSSTSVKRVATYVSWYNELGYLYVERSGAGIEFITELLEALKKENINPYEFQKITYRPPGSIEVEELEDGFKVIDKREGEFFSTNSSSNPQELE